MTHWIGWTIGLVFFIGFVYYMWSRKKSSRALSRAFKRIRLLYKDR